MTPEQRLRYAQQLQENPLINEVLSQCRGAAFARWQAAPDVQTRELCWLQWQAYAGFETTLSATLAAIIKNPTPVAGVQNNG